MSLASSYSKSLGIAKIISASLISVGLFSCGSGAGNENKGKTAYADANCASCHSAGESNQGFNLAAKKIYSESALATYIEKYMPSNNVSACVGDCAKNIASYIASYHDFPKDPGSTTQVPPKNETFVCNQATSYGNRALRPLTKAQYQRTVADLLGVNFDVTPTLPPDDLSGSFYNNTNVSILSNSYTSYVQAGQDIAKWLAGNSFRPATTSCSAFNSQCYNDIINTLAPKIFRRPLTSEEKTTFTNIANGGSNNGDIKAGVELAIAVMLSSPQFIYRSEIGEANAAMGSGVYELTDYETATFLSYTFTGSTPDDTLMQAAKNGALRTPAQIQAQTNRLLNGSTTKTLMEELVHLWLGTDVLDKFVKSSANISNYKAIIPDLEKELSLNFSDAMLATNGSFKDIYTPGYTYLNQNLANHYGINGVSGSNFRKVNTDERGGILLSGAFLSLYGDSEDASPIRRAVYLRRNMLCQDIPPPPAGVSTGREAAASKHSAELALATTTNRRHYDLVTSEGVCTNCHTELINPLGFGLEDYDTVGRFRTRDLKGNQIDASGEMFSPYMHANFLDTPNRDTTSLSFQGGQDLAELMTESAQAKACLAQQIMSYSTGLDVLSLNNSDRVEVLDLNSEERDGYGCVVEDMKAILTNESPRAMLEKLGSMDTIRYRKAWNR